MSDSSPPSRRKPTGEYLVGNCRPPVATRFQPGQSGNKKGKPKGATSLASEIKKHLRKKIVVVRDGVKGEMLGRAALAEKIWGKALSGDRNSIETVIRFDTTEEGGAGPATPPATVSADDNALLDAFLRDAQLGVPAAIALAEQPASTERPPSPSNENAEQLSLSTTASDGSAK
jgi:hypothetical protein